MPQVPPSRFVRQDLDDLSLSADRLEHVVYRPLHHNDDRRHRVEQIDGRETTLIELVEDRTERVDDRRHPEPKQQQELEQMLNVTQIDVDRRKENTYGRR